MELGEFENGTAQEIIPRLFLGSQRAAISKNNLQKHKITHIVTCNGLSPSFPNLFKYKVNSTINRYIVTCHLGSQN